MSSFGVVLDACVLFSAPLRDTLLRAAEQGLYRVHLTDEILEETRRNLVSTQRTTEEKSHRLVNTIKDVFPEALVGGYELLIPVMTNDPKDRHVLAAAVVSQSQVIVTHNLKDFRDEALSPFSIEAQSPDHFLTNLYDLDPDAMVQIIMEEANELRNPPQSVERVLETLAQQAPNFVSQVRTSLGISTTSYPA